MDEKSQSAKGRREVVVESKGKDDEGLRSTMVRNTPGQLAGHPKAEIERRAKAAKSKQDGDASV